MFSDIRNDPRLSTVLSDWNNLVVAQLVCKLAVPVSMHDLEVARSTAIGCLEEAAGKELQETKFCYIDLGWLVQCHNGSAHLLLE